MADAGKTFRASKVGWLREFVRIVGTVGLRVREVFEGRFSVLINPLDGRMVGDTTDRAESTLDHDDAGRG
jgi:hypothetical protein